MDDNTPMGLACDAARRNIESGNGGPFGAAIVLNGEVIAVAANTVLADHDPTAHAEVNAIRQAAARLGTHDLSGCVIYATGYPCPMCLAAITWANITEAYYALDVEEAARIGFRDDAIYDMIRSGDWGALSLEKMSDGGCEDLYDDYISAAGGMY